jgi:hypothetical protein
MNAKNGKENVRTGDTAPGSSVVVNSLLVYWKIKVYNKANLLL